jgi:NAD(P)-dependent dehydrogenase (short-subunit alcohol dehydrogenase family)
MNGPIDGDLSGRLALVTGASSGIGREVARDLARLGAEVILAVRSPERGEAARADLARSVKGARLRVERVDFGSQASICAFAARVLDAVPQLDVLVNNAAIFPERKQPSPEGIELTFATNVLGYFLTTALLLPALQRAPRARIVNVASTYASGLDLHDVGFDRRPWSGGAAYAQSKQVNRMWTWALARRLRGSNVTANALHPGVVGTNLLRTGWGSGGRAPSEGADTASWLAAAREVEGVTDTFFVDRRPRRCEFRGEAAEEALWRLCEDLAGGAPVP